MATAEIVVKVKDMPAVRAVIEAAVCVCEARNGGADCYEAAAEINRLQDALRALGESVRGFRTLSDT